MPHFDPTEFGRILARLTPQELRQAEDLIVEARKHTAAVLEIDARADSGGPASSCNRCGGNTRIRWGQTRTGEKRWHCSRCRGTWSGLSGTLLAQVHRPELVVALAHDMNEATQPISYCRRVEELGASRYSILRWRMAICSALTLESDVSLAGIVEADKTRQRESRKGSGAWVQHRHDPDKHPASLRLQRRAYRRGSGSATARPGGWRTSEKHLIAATDCAAHRLFEAITVSYRQAISAALLPVMAPDAVLCKDGFVTYERIAKDERIARFALNAVRCSRGIPPSHDINTGNALISRFRPFMQPFCGPRSKCLAAHGRWHAARSHAGRSYLDSLGPKLASRPRTNTIL